ncbi:efflux RND transporter permease subunit [Fimbriiglobus ruber]|uniref:Cobalt-zinc-cadmium resistance protein CzcA / Cation efflux system protein CusA n=1 Tax=Fimbriiglobus ruber TaxID=1908690 RepID=A0A225CZ54_9BACT|nr:CusA/CzcA family heavy metal efflux RND transporter [Fimbriiglobus ruber]OWK34532.1 Cobalt-zinc-cadmium resistance protein CzcA / Cation efflux system protein CusA [Fimbriiglobus ruber]
MIARLIEAAVRLKWLVVLFAFLVVGAGVWSFRQQPIDAYPDISSQMVQVITVYPGRAPEEVERQVTIPVENAMLGTPKVQIVRSRTIFGLSLVQMIFEEGTENYWARQRVTEKLNDLTLPDGVQPQLGPLATAYGEVYRYELTTDGGTDLTTLRELNDWVVIRALKRAAGVAEVANFGGYEKQFAITFYPAQLERFGLTLSDVEDAVKKNNSAGGGSVVSRGSMSLVIRGGGLLENIHQIEGIFVKSVGGTPVYFRDVAAVGYGAKVPNGIFSKDHTDESVEGIVLMRKGENPSQVLERVQAGVAELNASGLPPGVQIRSYYDRTQLVDSTLHTVSHSVLLGITLVVLVLLLFLGRPAMATLVAATIPFSLLFALVLMYATGIPIGLLSIGAIDFGIIVDGAVIMAEHIARRLGEASHRGGRLNVPRVVLSAALEMERPVFFSVLMIVVAYLPLLSLGSIEGLLFRPMALTMVYALGGALLFALFLVPVLATILFRNGYSEWENPLLRWSRPVYSAVLRGLLAVRWLVVAAAICGMAIVGMRVVPHLGIEFLPYMDEGVIWVRANYPEGTSLEQTSEYGRRLREIALEFPDVKFVVVQTGRNDDGTDPFPPSRIEMMVGPHPREHWKQFRTKRDLIAALGKRYRDEFPTTRFNFTQPIIDSVTEDTNGTSANLAVEFSGPDSTVLLDMAHQTVDLLREIRGATDVNVEQEGPQPQLVITPDRALCARYNVRIEDVAKLINMAIGGDPVGSLYERDRKFDIVARLDRRAKESPTAIGRVPVYTADGVPVPLAQVARIEVIDGQTLIARENSRRRITVRCDIVDRDQGGFVEEAQKRFAEKIKVPAGYKIGWLGMFENLDRAYKHFLTLIPATIGLIFVLLIVTFKSLRSAILVVAVVPFAGVGGVIALYVRDMHMNVSTGVGFAALFGIAIMDGVLMVRWINTLREQGMDRRAAIVEGAQERLRPILMTAIVAIFGLLPASLATGLGSDVQRPLATVIVWGLFSSTVLTLFVVPVLYDLFSPRITRLDTPSPDHAPTGHSHDAPASVS